MTYEHNPKADPVPYAESLTIPNQSMTVLQMVQRYQKGLPIDGQAFPLYQGEDALPDISHLDLADQQQIVEAYAEQLADIKNRLQTKAKTEAEKKQLDMVNSLVQAELKKLANPPAPSAGGDAK